MFKLVFMLFVVQGCLICCLCGYTFSKSVIYERRNDYFNVCNKSLSRINAKYSNTAIYELEDSEYDDRLEGENRSILHIWKLYPLTIFKNIKQATPQCINSFNNFLKRLHQNDLNATKMFDATAKLPSGILRGNVNQYGDFDECMELEEAQYCLADINIEPLWKKPYLKFKDLVHSNFPIKDTFDDPKHRVPGFTMIRWGFCIPKECTNKDLEKVIYEKLQVPIKIRPNMCQQAKKPSGSKLGYGDIFARCFFLIIAVATGLSTFLHSQNLCQNSKSTSLKILMCFAIQPNYKELTTIEESKKEIQALHGVRALSALALIISHKVMALFYNPFMNRSVMSENLGMKWSVIGRTAILYTECFMLLSGLLSANSLFADMDKRRVMQFKDKVLSRLYRAILTVVPSLRMAVEDVTKYNYMEFRTILHCSIPSADELFKIYSNYVQVR